MAKPKKDTANDEQTKRLEQELGRIAKDMQNIANDLTKQAESDDSPEAGEKVKNKIEHIIEKLTNEMVQLAGKFHRHKDIVTIEHFLEEQREMIQAVLTTEEETEKRQSLRERITELHKIMAEERRRVKQIGMRENLKFAVTLTIAVVSLLVSVYAVFIR